MMSNSKYTDQERAELNAISSVLKSYVPVFKYSPEIIQGMVVIYRNLLKEYGYNADNLNDVFNSLSKQTSQFPSLLEVRHELNSYVDGNKKFTNTITYSVISKAFVKDCFGNRELLFRKYLSNGLYYVLGKKEFDAYLIDTKNCINSDKLFYEVAYCRLHQMGVKGLIKPEMTIPKIWRFCGLITTNHGCDNVADAMRIAKPKRV
jgi:hypothetical protein